MKYAQFPISLLLACLAIFLPCRACAMTATEQADAFHTRGLAAVLREDFIAAAHCYSLTLRINPGHAGAQAGMAELEKKILPGGLLKLQLPRVEFRDVTLSEALGWLQSTAESLTAGVSDARFEIRDPDGLLKRSRITLSLRSVTLETILNSACKMAKAQYQVDANTVTISPKELKELLLDEETPLSAKVGWGKYWANKFTEDRDAQILLDGRPCEHFIFPHANSSVTFAVPAGFTRFSAVGIGPTKKARREYSWTYQVLADEKSVYQSKRLDSYPGNKLPIEVELPPGTRTLTLITDIAGNGFADHSIWADPKLLRPPLSAETLAKLAQLEAQFRKASASAPASQLKKLQDNYDAQLASLAQSLAGKPAEADAVNAIRRRTSAMLPTTPAATK